MLLPDGPIAVVCEWIEDYVVLYHGRPPELVSVRHRESSQGPWTLADLIRDGGLSHLLSRWNRYGRRTKARLCTNAGLKPGDSDAAGLRKACADGDTDRLRAFAEKMAPKLGADCEAVVAFLACLRIDDDRPKRRDIAAVQAVWLRTPLRELGLDPTRDVDYYERIVEMIVAASSDQPLAPDVLLAHLNRPDALSSRMLQDIQLLNRLVDREMLLSSLRDPLAPGHARSTPPTRMRRKLEAGGFGPTAVHRAQRLRAAWYAFSRAVQDGTSADIEQVRDYVLEQAEASETRTQGHEQYGLKMAEDLRARFESTGDAAARRLGVGPRLLMGCALELTDECQIWWSPEGEVDLS